MLEDIIFKLVPGLQESEPFYSYFFSICCRCFDFQVSSKVKKVLTKDPLFQNTYFSQ